MAEGIKVGGWISYSVSGLKDPERSHLVESDAGPVNCMSKLGGTRGRVRFWQPFQLSGPGYAKSSRSRTF
jgi:hypothetical protein